MKLYFKANVEDATRIAVIEADTIEEIWEAAMGADEITVNDLPADFASWSRYTAYASGTASIEVMSENGI